MRFGGGDAKTTYTLDGKETTKDIEGQDGRPGMQLTQKASLGSDGKLNIVSIRKLTTPMGEMEIKTAETWELADNGNTLKINRAMQSPRGEQVSEMVFAKGKIVAVPMKDAATSTAPDMPATPPSEAKPAPKFVDTGVVNGKAANLALPKYPVDAMNKGVGGVVKVKVMIDEQGNVTFAEAIEGEEMLRQACVDAAKLSKFVPTKLGGNAVKVRGIVVYNFTATLPEKKPQ
jgi:protein TonB